MGLFRGALIEDHEAVVKRSCRTCSTNACSSLLVVFSVLPLVFSASIGSTFPCSLLTLLFFMNSLQCSFLPSFFPSSLWFFTPPNHLYSDRLYRETSGGFSLISIGEGLDTGQAVSTALKSTKRSNLEPRDDIVAPSASDSSKPYVPATLSCPSPPS
jgi:hypothetical protein